MSQFVHFSLVLREQEEKKPNIPHLDRNKLDSHSKDERYLLHHPEGLGEKIEIKVA